MIVARPGESVTAEDIIATVRARLARDQKSKLLTFVGEIPRTMTEMLLKRSLRSRFADESD